MKNKPGSIIWLAVGVFLLVMGLYFLINPHATLASIAWLFGLTMLVSGAADLVLCVARQWAYGSSKWFFADGIIDLLVGIVFMCNSWLAAELLPYLLAAWAILSGVIKCVGALVYRGFGMPFWGVQFAVGVIVLVFGLVILFRPEIAAITISAVVAIVLIAQGLMALMRGLFASSPHR
ncbi:MAG TPA: DUF308 domain-containing protein [Candidatus Agathobaculum stercoravium]|nr:DUF308 domain-containing protein [Candidatus Agathobaculum stercoravium]